MASNKGSKNDIKFFLRSKREFFSEKWLKYEKFGQVGRMETVDDVADG
jgi:hypothetical protein